MPVAESFNALGVGNGFPECLGLEVTTFDLDRWTTLSGVNKDNVGSFNGGALDDKIAESLILAMKLYWNLYSVDAYSEAKFVNTSVNDTAIADGANVSGDYEEPKSRICGAASGFSGEQVGSVFADISIVGARPVRMTNNGTLVGYSLGVAGGSVVGIRANSVSSAVTSLTLSNHTIEEQTDTSNQIYDYAYVDLGGMNLVCAVSARRTIGTATLTVDAANLTAESAYSGTSTRNASSSFTSFGFYSYPA